jgi:integrase
MTKAIDEVILCSYCNGTGKVFDHKVCQYCELWDGRYVSKFYYNWVSEVKSPSTVHGYNLDQVRFVKYLSLNNISELETFYQKDGNDKESNIDNLTNIIKTYIKKDIAGRRGTGPDSQEKALATIFALYDANRVKGLDKQFIRKSVKEKIDVNDDSDDDDRVPYTLREVQDLYASCGDSRCYTTLFSLLASTGMRVGGVYEPFAPTYTEINGHKYSDNFLKIKDFDPAIKEIEREKLVEAFNNKLTDLGCPELTDVYRITVYRHSGKHARYDTYCDEDTTARLKRYWQSRIDAGEPTGDDGKLLPDAPAFRKEFGTQKSRAKNKFKRDRTERRRIENIKVPIPLTIGAMEPYINRRRKQVNVNPETVDFHSFRKFYETELREPRSDGNMDRDYCEILMGQKPSGMGKHYNMPGPEKLLAVYWKYHQRVMIDQTKVVNAENAELKKTIKGELAETKNIANAALAGLGELVRGFQTERLQQEKERDYLPINQIKQPLEHKDLDKEEEKRRLKARLAELEKEE